MHKIQIEQGRALEREGEIPEKLKIVIEELRVAKERNKQLEQRMRLEERNSRQQ